MDENFRAVIKLFRCFAAFPSKLAKLPVTLYEKKLMLFTIGLLLISQPSIAEKKWYTVVDIGQHMDSSGVTEEKLSKGQVKEIFQKEIIFQEEALKRYEKIKAKWLEDNGAEYLNKFKNNKIFYLDRRDHPISASIYEFSKSKAKIHIKFKVMPRTEAQKCANI